MQTTKATRRTSRIAKLAATVVLATGLLVGSAATATAEFNAPHFEPLDGGGGGASARLGFMSQTAEAPVGVMRGGRYVGFLPE